MTAKNAAIQALENLEGVAKAHRQPQLQRRSHMPKEFYTERDIEDMVKRGIHVAAGQR